jgi:hypothetical protein
MAIRFEVTGSFVKADVTGVLSMEDLPPLFTTLIEANERGPFVLLTDTTDLGQAPRAVISAFAAQLKKTPLRNWLADAVVLTSPTIRFILATLLVVAPMPMTVKAFDKRADAERWCREFLAGQGISPSPAA